MVVVLHRRSTNGVVVLVVLKRLPDKNKQDETRHDMNDYRDGPVKTRQTLGLTGLTRRKSKGADSRTSERVGRKVGAPRCQQNGPDGTGLAGCASSWVWGKPRHKGGGGTTSN